MERKPLESCGSQTMPPSNKLALKKRYKSQDSNINLYNPTSNEVSKMHSVHSESRSLRSENPFCWEKRFHLWENNKKIAFPFILSKNMLERQKNWSFLIFNITRRLPWPQSCSQDHLFGGIRDFLSFTEFWHFFIRSSFHDIWLVCVTFDSLCEKCFHDFTFSTI